MYRQYEDPYKLEIQLAALKLEYEQEDNEYIRECLAESIYELEERINFAWQDDEYDSDYYSGDFED